MKKYGILNAAMVLGLLFVSGASAADDGRTSDGAALRAIELCMAVEESTARLTCFEKASAAFDFESAIRLLNEAVGFKKAAEAATAKAAEEKAKAAQHAAVAAAEKAKADKLAVAAAAEKAKADKLAAAAAAEKAKADALTKAAEEEKARQLALKKDEFGKADAEVKTVDVIETEIKKMRKPRVGGVVFMFVNNQVWQQADGDHPGRIKVGMKVRIRKTMMGGYVMTILKTRKVLRVKRII